MSTATHPGPVNVYQLNLELGMVPLDVYGDTTTGPVEIHADDIDQDTLTAAVAAHVADPSIVFDAGPEPTPDPPCVFDAAGNRYALTVVVTTTPPGEPDIPQLVLTPTEAP